MGRSDKSFGRPEPSFKQHPKVLIICEDTKSGKRYLEDAAFRFRVNDKVDVAHVEHTDPRGIVQQAIARSKKRKYDTIYCVIDRDTHETFDEAVELAKPFQNIELLVSYPCFEFWLLLHFKYSRKTYKKAGKLSPGDQMLRALQKCPCMDLYDKGADISFFDLLQDKLPTARKHATRVMTEALEVESFDPSTRLHNLFDAFEILQKPQKI
jgi:hypothetical protein